MVELAKAGRLDAISLTDHDTTSGVVPAQEAARGLDLEVIPGIEMSTTDAGREIHVLGYFVDPFSPALLAREQRAHDLRRRRMAEMVARLGTLGLDISLEAVQSVPGADLGNIGRPHLARALVDAGHAANIGDAFDRFIGNDCPAFVPTQVSGPEEAVELIRSVGGVAVWAHPPKDALEDLTKRMVDAGLQGLEIFRPNHGSQYMSDLEAIARSHGLVRTGGSDWHGPDNGALGGFHVSGTDIADFLALGGL